MTKEEMRKIAEDAWLAIDGIGNSMEKREKNIKRF
jgi:hypothetical protein